MRRKINQLKLTQRRKLVDKGIKIVIIAIFYVQEDWTSQIDMEDIKDQNWTCRDESYNI